MDTKENLHQGHRERAIQKLFQNPQGLAEHEILEIILFSVIPRKDTNALAHRLLRTFGSLSKVFSASAQELVSVDGVGKRVAGEIVALGKVIEIVGKSSKEDNSVWYSVNTKKTELIEMFKNEYEEKFVLILLNGRRKKLTAIHYEDKRGDTVSAEIPEIARAIALHKPKYAIIAHNHPSFNPNPSHLDDVATMKINVLCAMHGVVLSDHVIVSGEKIYSYHTEGRMDYLKSVSDLDKLLSDKKGVIYE